MAFTQDEERRILEMKDYKEFVDWALAYKENVSTMLTKFLRKAQTFPEAEKLIDDYTCETDDESIFDEFWNLINKYSNATPGRN